MVERRTLSPPRALRLVRCADREKHLLLAPATDDLHSDGKPGAEPDRYLEHRNTEWTERSLAVADQTLNDAARAARLERGRRDGRRWRNDGVDLSKYRGRLAHEQRPRPLRLHVPPSGHQQPLLEKIGAGRHVVVAPLHRDVHALPPHDRALLDHELVQPQPRADLEVVAAHVELVRHGGRSAEMTLDIGGRAEVRRVAHLHQPLRIRQVDRAGGGDHFGRRRVRIDQRARQRTDRVEARAQRHDALPAHSAKGRAKAR